MKWSYWIELYIRTHCVARGLRPLTLAAYEDALKQFHEWVRVTRADIAPDQIAARDVLAYLQYLRDVRGNGASAVNRAVVVLRRFYCAALSRWWKHRLRSRCCHCISSSTVFSCSGSR